MRRIMQWLAGYKTILIVGGFLTAAAFASGARWQYGKLKKFELQVEREALQAKIEGDARVQAARDEERERQERKETERLGRITAAMERLSSRSDSLEDTLRGRQSQIDRISRALLDSSDEVRTYAENCALRLWPAYIGDIERLYQDDQSP